MAFPFRRYIRNSNAVDEHRVADGRIWDALEYLGRQVSKILPGSSQSSPATGGSASTGTGAGGSSSGTPGPVGPSGPPGKDGSDNVVFARSQDIVFLTDKAGKLITTSEGYGLTVRSQDEILVTTRDGSDVVSLS